MKKLFVTLLAFFYLSVASGVGVYLHYCMGDLVSWSVYDSGKHSCDFCGMDKAEGKADNCCKDVKHHAKVDQAQKANVSLFKFEQSIADVIINNPIALLIPVDKQQAISEINSNAPPETASVPIYVKNCIYRI